jgi:hypothetical protein
MVVACNFFGDVETIRHKPAPAQIPLPRPELYDLHRDVDDIVLMAMHPEPDKRYPSAADFEADIHRQVGCVLDHDALDDAALQYPARLHCGGDRGEAERILCAARSGRHRDALQIEIHEQPRLARKLS